MIRLAALLLWFGIAMSAGAAEPADPPEKCAVLVESATGTFEHHMLPSLHVASLTSADTFALPPDAPSNVKVVQCGRPSLAPRDTDYKVLAAGYAFSIVADDRAAVMEIEDGRLRFRMVKGEMTEGELPRVQAFLDRAQEHFNEFTPSLLDSLATELRALRALPVGAPSSAKCPANTKSLIGLSGAQLQDALGTPDFVDKQTEGWAYFFTSPLQPMQRGGGHPELGFTFGPAGQVAQVSCRYAQ